MNPYSFDPLYNYFVTNWPKQPYGQVKVQLVVDFLTDGIISKSLPGSVFDSREDAASFLRIMKDIVWLLRSELPTFERKPEMGVVVMSTDMIAQLGLLCVELNPLLLLIKGIAIDEMINRIIACDLTLAFAPGDRIVHGQIVILVQLSMYASITRYLDLRNPQYSTPKFVKRADKYFASLVVAGDAAKLAYDERDVKIPVISKCVLQSLGDPEFNLYKFFIIGPPALFYNNVRLMDEMAYCLDMYMYDGFQRDHCSMQRIQREYCQTHDTPGMAYRRVTTMLRINSIHGETNQQRVKALRKKFGDKFLVPIVTFVRPI